MAIAASGQVSLNDIQTEFTNAGDGVNPIQLSEYYDVDDGVPSSGMIAVSDFHGTEQQVGWASAESGTRARRGVHGMGNSQSGLVAGGYDTDYRAYADSHNGTSFSTETNMSGTKFDGWYAGGGGGTSEGACITICGYRYAEDCEEWNGSSWSSGGNVTWGVTSVQGNGNSNGTQTDCAKLGGEAGGTGLIKLEVYNGTSFSTETDLTTGVSRGGLIGAGHDDLLNVSGYWGGSYSTSCNSYDGTSWSSEGAIPTQGRQALGLFGESSNAYMVGGYNTHDAYATYKYNGTSWSDNSTDTTVERVGAGTYGAGTSGFNTHGNDPNVYTSENFVEAA